MRRFGCALWLCLSIALISSCYTIKVETNREPSYNSFLQKVAVIVETGNVVTSASSAEMNNQVAKQTQGSDSHYAKLSDYLSDKIVSEFTALKIESRAMRRSGLELDEGQLQSEIDAYSPKQILTLELAEGAVSQSNFLMNGTFDAILYDVDLGKRIWRAKLVLQEQSEWGAGAGNLVGELIASLRKDDLIIEFSPAQ